MAGYMYAVEDLAALACLYRKEMLQQQIVGILRGDEPSSNFVELLLRADDARSIDLLDGSKIALEEKGQIDHGTSYDTTTLALLRTSFVVLVLYHSETNSANAFTTLADLGGANVQDMEHAIIFQKDFIPSRTFPSEARRIVEAVGSVNRNILEAVSRAADDHCAVHRGDSAAPATGLTAQIENIGIPSTETAEPNRMEVVISGQFAMNLQHGRLSLYFFVFSVCCFLFF